MSELDEFEFQPADLDYDPYEYAEQLGYTDELTRGDFSDPAAVRATPTPEEDRGLTRRDVLVRGGVGAAAVAGLTAAGPAAAAPSRRGQFEGTFRVITLGVEWPPGAEQQVEKDLGFRFNVQLMSTNAQVQKSITAPNSFDMLGGYNYQFFQIWPTGNFAPLDRRRIRAWNRFYPIFSRGKVQPNNQRCTPGQGNAPFRVLYVDRAGSQNGIGRSTGLPLTKEGPRTNRQIVQWWDEQRNRPYRGRPEPRWILGPPAHFNMDSMGYNGDVIRKRPEQVSWAELLNNRHRGRVAVLNDPGIAMADLGNAVQALGLMKFRNLGNMTRAEMDRLFTILSRYRRRGHFRAFWSTFNESVNLMASKEVVIESMWSPAVALLVAQGVPVRYAYPPEGMRGWCSCQGIPRHVAQDSAKLDAAYRYLNWMHEGFLGALIMRQGYYVANGRDLPRWIRSQRAREGKPPFTIDEYNFWYNGAAAPKDLPGITGRVGDIKRGQRRDGGSFLRRSCKYTSWNSFFTENVYQVRKFNDFISG
jgi:putative spermidine/putrescine transport system substrate-binding protein